MRKRFTSPVHLEGKTATSIEVPSSVVEALGPSRRPPVRITVRGYSFRTTVAAYCTQYFVPLSREHRTAAGVEASEKVTVYIELDDEPRVVDVPDDFTRALKSARQRSYFDTLSYSHQREYVEWITAAKRPETRTRRIARAVDMLAERRPSPR